MCFASFLCIHHLLGRGSNLNRHFFQLRVFKLVASRGLWLLLSIFSTSAAGAEISGELQSALSANQASLGNPIFIRIIKRPQPAFDERMRSGRFDFDDYFHPRRRQVSNGDDFFYRSLPRQSGVYFPQDEWESKNGGPASRFSSDVGRLEVWIRTSDGSYRNLKNYPISAYAGPLGPKLREGDVQSPEGFYEVDYLRPRMTKRELIEGLHVTFPNAFDRAHQPVGQPSSLGSDIFIHGGQVTAGCFAVDSAVRDLYALADAARKVSGQNRIPLHIFPFPLTDENLKKIPDAPSGAFDLKGFWKKLQPGYLAFENDRAHLPPTIGFTSHGEYVVSCHLPHFSRMIQPESTSCPSPSAP